MKVFKPKRMDRLIEEEGKLGTMEYEDIVVVCETDEDLIHILKYVKEAIKEGIATYTYQAQPKRMTEAGVDMWTGHHETIIAFIAYEPQEMRVLRKMVREILIESRPKQVREKAEKRGKP